MLMVFSKSKKDGINTIKNLILSAITQALVVDVSKLISFVCTASEGKIPMMPSLGKK